MISTLFTGMMGGFLAWIATAIVGQPLIKFMNLRSQAAIVLARFDTEGAKDDDGAPLAPEDYEDDWKTARQKDYADCGCELVAFHAANATLVLLLRKLPKKWRCYPKSAGLSFQSLAESVPGGNFEHETRRHIISALKLNFW
jgi:hypothetical protein